MIERLRAESSWTAQRWTDDAAGVAMARVGRGADGERRHVASSGTWAVVFEGELFVAPGMDEQRESSADYLLRQYAQSGSSFLADVEGRFTAAIWSAEDSTITLLTDKFGTKPLYYSEQSGGFAFSSSIQAVAALSATPKSLNHAGLVQFFTFGHLWNADTFYSSIHCVEPASCLVFNVLSNEATRTRYWRPAPVKPTTDEQSLHLVAATLKHAVDEQTADVQGLAVALSGGLDARTMLALVETDRLRPLCVSLGMEGSLDQRSARQLAELADCTYSQFTLAQDFLERFETHLNHMIRLTDGHYLSQCIVMPTLPLYQERGVRVLLRGHAGELMHMHKAYNFSVDRAFHSVRSDLDLRRWLWARLQSHLTEGVPEPILVGITSEEFAESGRRTLQHALQQTEHWDHPLDRISQLFLDQRTRRETAMSLGKFDSVVDARVPYLDGRVVQSVFSCSPQLRVGEGLQAHILRRHRPGFLRIANSNTGAPVGASEVRTRMSYLRMKVLAKLGVKGYQPYERLGLWLRRELRPLVERILLNPRCLDRGLLQPDCVRNVVRRHTEGKQNHTYLILAMMILELGLRHSATEALKTDERVCPQPASL